MPAAIGRCGSSGQKVCDVPFKDCVPRRGRATRAAAAVATIACYLSSTHSDHTVCDCPFKAVAEAEPASAPATAMRGSRAPWTSGRAKTDVPAGLQAVGQRRRLPGRWERVPSVQGGLGQRSPARDLRLSASSATDEADDDLGAGQLRERAGLCGLARVGCFKPDVANGGFICADGGVCPDGFTCAPIDNRCYKADAGPSGLPDAAPGSAWTGVRTVLRRAKPAIRPASGAVPAGDAP